MRILIYLIFISLFISCSNEAKIDGNWKFTLKLKNTELPFMMSFSKKDKNIHAKLYNAEEVIELNNVKIYKNTINIELTNKVSLIGKIQNNTIEGHWVKHERVPVYKVPFIATKTKSLNRFETQSNNELDRKWKMSFKGQKNAILLFKSFYPTIKASVLTKTGDYRYLEGFIKNETLNLYGFDGVFAFVFKAKLRANEFVGKMYAGKSHEEDFIATPNHDFQLSDPENITTFDKGHKISFSLKDSNGSLINFNGADSRPTVLQIFGSWCPNCIDETNFIKKWIQKNPNLINIYAIAFEREKNEKAALKTLVKVKHKLQMNYPILLGGATKEDKVDKLFPGIKNFISFPTTIFIDKKGNIRKVHAGFNGPATDFYYEEFKTNFDAFVKELARE